MKKHRTTTARTIAFLSALVILLMSLPLWVFADDGKLDIHEVKAYYDERGEALFYMHDISYNGSVYKWYSKKFVNLYFDADGYLVDNDDLNKDLRDMSCANYPFEYYNTLNAGDPGDSQLELSITIAKDMIDIMKDKRVLEVVERGLSVFTESFGSVMAVYAGGGQLSVAGVSKVLLKQSADEIKKNLLDVNRVYANLQMALMDYYTHCLTEDMEIIEKMDDPEWKVTSITEAREYVKMLDNFCLTQKGAIPLFEAVVTRNGELTDSFIANFADLLDSLIDDYLKGFVGGTLDAIIERNVNFGSLTQDQIAKLIVDTEKVQGYMKNPSRKILDTIRFFSSDSKVYLETFNKVIAAEDSYISQTKLADRRTKAEIQAIMNDHGLEPNTMSGTCGSNLTWELDLGTGVLRISGTGAMNSYNYKSDSNPHHNGTTAPWNAYWGKIKSVIIEDGVTTIGYSAFRGCQNIQTVRIPESVTYIGELAFEYCSSLTSVNLPKKLKRLNGQTFSSCKSLSSITLPSGLASMGTFCFSDCTSLTDITIPEGVSVIESSVFSGCSSLSKVTLPEGLVKIGMYAFSGCASLFEIDIPDSVISIDYGAFGGCSSLTDCDLPIGLNKISSELFKGCVSLSKISIPNTVTSIGNHAFENCYSLVSISLPTTLKTVESCAFCGCSSLVYATYNATKEEWNENVSVKTSSYHSNCNQPLKNALTFLPTHTHSPTVQVATEAYLAAPATCTIPATYYYSCTCGEKGTETFTYGATAPHTEETIPAEKATCTKDGYTAGKHCSVCGTVLQSQETIPAMGHTPGDWITDIEPAVGVEGHCQQSCTVCNKVLNEETIPALPEETEPETEPVTEPKTEPVTEPETDPITEPESEPETDPVTEAPTEAPSDDSATTEEPTAEELSTTPTITVGCSGSILSCGLLTLIALAGTALIKRKE